jgi:tubulin polyglutamylase TTLL7
MELGRVYAPIKPMSLLTQVRLSTERYSPPSDSNLEETCMHLTNYSINRHSASFDTDERDDRGSKRTLSSFMAWLHKTGHNVVELWAKIHDIIVKTLILAYPHILHSCTVSRHGHLPNGKSQFFEILGFDVLLDHTLQPWVLEVNRSPSFGTDAELDLHIKTAVIRDALKLANFSLSDKLTEEACQRQASKRRQVSSKPHTSHTHSGQYDFLAEQADAAAKKASRRAAAKERLTQLRRERELEEFENENKGGYVRVYPTSDPSRAQLYCRLLDDALSFNSLGRSSSTQSSRSGSSVGGCGLSGIRDSGRGLQDMEEPELLEILLQCEDESSYTAPLPSVSHMTCHVMST